MTPQTPRAALSDADIRDLVKECGLDWHRGFVPLFDGDPTNRYAVLVRAAIDADRRLTAEQPVGKFWCESCDGTGKIDERLTAYSDSNPAAECPDCDGNGWWQSAPVTAEQPVAWEGAEEWEPLAWELCANECGEDACNELIWEGGAVPEPWGERWLKYEDEAKRLIAMVRKYAPAPVTAEQGGAEPPKPFCHVVNMLEGLPENPSYIMLFDGQRFGNGFTHTALYTGEQLVAALTTQPQAQPTGWIRVEDRLPPKFEEVLVFFRDGTLAATGQYTDNQHDHDGWCYPAECHAEDEWPVVSHWMPLPATPTAPTEPT